MEMDGTPIMTCPRRWIKDEPEKSSSTFWAYKRYDKGQLPEDGGLQSQPHKFMMVMRTMEAAFGKVEDENEKRRNRKRSNAESMAAGKRPPRVSPGGRLRK